MKGISWTDFNVCFPVLETHVQIVDKKYQKSKSRQGPKNGQDEIYQ